MELAGAPSCSRHCDQQPPSWYAMCQPLCKKLTAIPVSVGNPDVWIPRGSLLLQLGHKNVGLGNSRWSHPRRHPKASRSRIPHQARQGQGQPPLGETLREQESVELERGSVRHSIPCPPVDHDLYPRKKSRVQRPRRLRSSKDTKPRSTDPTTSSHNSQKSTPTAALLAKAGILVFLVLDRCRSRSKMPPSP